MQNGKGDKLRKGANLPAYWENYDRVFQKRKTVKEWSEFLGVKIQNWSGFEEFNIDDLLTEEEFKKGLNYENH
jgi:hypothetical protein